MDMGNYSLTGTLGALLYLIIKLLIIVLAVVVVLGVVVWVRDNLFKNDSSKIVRDIKSDPLLKAVAVITLAVVGIVFLFSIINNILSPGMAPNMNGGMGHQGAGGFNPAYGIAGVLYLLIRVLTFILIISLVLAGIVYLKDLYESGKLNIFGAANKTTENNGPINISDSSPENTETGKKV